MVRSPQYLKGVHNTVIPRYFKPVIANKWHKLIKTNQQAKFITTTFTIIMLYLNITEQLPEKIHLLSTSHV